MKNKIIILAMFALSLTGFAQTLTNYDTTTVHVVSGVTITGETLASAFVKTWNNLLYLYGLETNLQSAAITNISAVVNTAATNPPSINFSNFSGNVVGYCNLPYVAAATNAVYPTPVYTLLDTNPLVFNGSNYIGHFTNVYSFKLNTPIVGAGDGLNPMAGSNQVENVYASYDNTNFFFVTNNPCRFYTNVYLSVVGSSVTNSGELILYSMLNQQYEGVNYDLTGTPVHVSDTGDSNNPVTYNAMNTYFGNRYGNTFTATGSGIGYAPYGTNLFTITANPLVGPTNITFSAIGTNQIISATTNQAFAYTGLGVLINTNLGNKNGWYFLSPSLYTVSTNAGKVSFTIPSINVSPFYSFYQIVANKAGAINAYAPLNAYSVIISRSNSWATVFTQFTNTALPGDKAFYMSSNGAAWFNVWDSNSVFVITASPQ